QNHSRRTPSPRICRPHARKRNRCAHDQLLLGHRSLSTTANYLRIAITKVCSATSPLDLLPHPVEVKAFRPSGWRTVNRNCSSRQIHLVSPNLFRTERFRRAAELASKHRNVVHATS